MKKRITILISMILLNIMLTAMLFYRSGENIKYTQNFYREYLQDSISLISALGPIENTTYIAGLDSTNIYIVSPQHRSTIITTDRNLKKIGDLNFSANNDQSSYQVYEKNVYTISSEQSTIKKTSLKDGQLLSILKDSITFNQIVPLTNNSFCIQTTITDQSNEKYRNALAIITTHPSSTQINPSILEAQIDEYFSTMGTLRFCKNLNKIIYTYRYRNRYEIIDLKLNKIDQGKTIDTVNYIKFKPVKLSKNEISIASPNAIVNINSQVDGKYLYIHSNLKDGYEDRVEFDKSNTIDIYDIETKRYISSIKIKDYKNEKVTNFTIKGTYMLVKFNTYLCAYTIPPIKKEI